MWSLQAPGGPRLQKTGETPMRRPLFLSGAVALIAAGQVQAAHAPGTVYTEVRGNSGTSGLNSAMWFRNGEPVGMQTGTWDAGPQVPGATEMWGTTAAATGSSNASSFSSASLNLGQLKARVDGNTVPFFGSIGGASATIQDRIFFTNTTSNRLPVTLSFKVDGAISANGAFTNWGFNSILWTSAVSGNGMGQSISANPDGTGTVQFALLGEQISNGQPFQFRDQFSGQINANIASWQFSFGPNHNPGAGLYDYNQSLTLWVPTGLTTFELTARMAVNLCNAGSIGTFESILCNFGDTAGLSFGPLPDGLSWTSQSGVFLSGIGNGGGGVVPEPATWAMLIIGFGLVGSTMRRRRIIDAAH